MSKPDLRAVLSAPLDDTPRRAYAAALGNDPRAEFIRIQLANRSTEPTPREHELLLAHRLAWIAPVAPLVQFAALARGFVQFASMTADQWLTNAAKLLSLAPILDLHLTDARGRPEIFAAPELSRLRSLDLSHNALTDADAIALADSKHLRGLRWLNLTNNQIGRPGLLALAASPNLPSLRWLGFAYNLAPDPVPVPTLDYGVIGSVEVPAIRDELIAKSGPKPWLEARNTDTTPDPATF
jgi:uncharacterized protein (TIGR02996 family)